MNIGTSMIGYYIEGCYIMIGLFNDKSERWRRLFWLEMKEILGREKYFVVIIDNGIIFMVMDMVSVLTVPQSCITILVVTLH